LHQFGSFLRVGNPGALFFDVIELFALTGISAASVVFMLLFLRAILKEAQGRLLE